VVKQESTAVGTDRPTVETGHDLTLPRPFKSETRLVTLWHSDGRPFLALTVVWKLSYAIEDGHLPIQREKSGLAKYLSTAEVKEVLGIIEPGCFAPFGRRVTPNQGVCW
jgi:hypothetical protein